MSEAPPHPPHPPLLPRILDAVTLVAALLAITAATTGGFREWTPFGRVSVTSWLRPSAIALAAALVRFYWWRADPLPVRVARGAQTWWRADDTRAVLPIFLASRLGVLLVGFLAVVLIGYGSESGAPWRAYRNEFLNLPARFDTGWYLGIAANGYQWNAGSPRGQQNIVFFPAYPMLVRYASLLMARQLIWTGVLLSCAAFFAALVYVHRLARQHLSQEQSVAAITFLCAYPFALFFSTAYTESLFLLAIAGACYHFGRDELWQAGAWGLLAGLTRPNGCLLSVVLALMLLVRIRGDGWRAWRDVPWSRYADRLAVASLPGLGMIIYSTFIYFLTGDPLQWSRQQIGWGRSYRSIDALVTDRITYIEDRGFYEYASTQTVDMLYASAVVFVLISVWPIFRRFGLPLAALVVLNVLPPLATGGLISMGRMTSVLFPTFLWLGAVVRPDHRMALAVVFAALQALCAAMFFTWRPIY
jgi:Mannosyltransferase (PIG-V)